MLLVLGEIQSKIWKWKLSFFIQNSRVEYRRDASVTGSKEKVKKTSKEKAFK